MPHPDKLNRHQKQFFSRLRRHPDGLPRKLWPRSGALGRWVHHPAFVRKLGELEAANIFFKRLDLVRASRLAARQLLGAMDDPHRLRLLLRVLSRGRSAWPNIAALVGDPGRDDAPSDAKSSTGRPAGILVDADPS